MMMRIRKIRRWLGIQKHKFLVDHYPKNVIDTIWKKQFGYTVDWKEPRDLNEKIEWLICYGDSRRWTELTDKIKVRDYVTSKGYPHLLNDLLGVWKDVDDIDFDKLPDRFVLKCNHDSGSCHIMDKKKGFDESLVKRQFRERQHLKFGYLYCEPHYNKIKPFIIAEEYLEDDKELSSSLIDYKVWCFYGKPFCVWTVHNRTETGMYTNVYDLNWVCHPELSSFSANYKNGRGTIPRPALLKEMLSVAGDLSAGFPQVRVDFYIVKEKLYFGEMTFTSACGRMDYFSKEYLIEMGKQFCIGKAAQKD